MHSSLIGKVEKANRYARELDRITIDRLSLTFRGDNDTHHVSLDAGQWHCTCHYFESLGLLRPPPVAPEDHGRHAARRGPGLDLRGEPARPGLIEAARGRPSPSAPGHQVMTARPRHGANPSESADHATSSPAPRGDEESARDHDSAAVQTSTVEA